MYNSLTCMLNLEYYENYGSNLNSHNLGNWIVKFYITKKLVTHWDAHLKDLVTFGKRKLNSLLRILCNPSLSLYLRRQVILSILRPSLEYGNEVWGCTGTQSKTLDAVLLGA